MQHDNKFLKKYITAGKVKGNLAGLKADQYVIAMILDPYTSPACANLPPDWLKSCTTVLKRFYNDEELDQAETEINQLVADEGYHWGECVSEIHRHGYQLLFETTTDHKEPGFYIDAVLALRQKPCFYVLTLFGRIHCRKSSHCSMKWHDMSL